MDVKKNIKQIVAISASVIIVISSIIYGVVKDNQADDMAQKVAVQKQLINELEKETATVASVSDKQEKVITEMNNTIIDLKNNQLTEEDKAVIDEYKQLLEEQEKEQEVETKVVYKEDELALDFSSTLEMDYRDLEQLEKSEVEFDDEDIDYETQFLLSGMFASNEKDFKGETMYLLEDEDVEYVMKFDEDMSELSYSNDTLEVEFLGKTYEISDWNSDEITVVNDVKSFVKAGDIVDGVQVLKIGEEAVALKVNGETEILKEGETKSFDDVEVKIDAIFYSDNGESEAVIVTSEELEKTIEDGDEYEADDRYNWKITSDSIGLVLDETFNDDDDALKEGEMFSLPEDFLKFGFELSKPDMTTVEFEYDNDGFVELKADFEEFEGNIIAYENGTLYDDDEEEFIDEDKIYFEDSDSYLKVVNDQIVIEDVNVSLKVDEVFVNNDGVSDSDDDVKSVYGIMVKEPEDALDDNTLTIEVPEEEVEATILVE